MMKRLLLLTLSLFSLTALEAAARFQAPAARVAGLHVAVGGGAAAPAAVAAPAARAVAAPAARGAAHAVAVAAPAGGAGAVEAPSAAELERRAREAARVARLAAMEHENEAKMAALAAAEADAPPLRLGEAVATTAEATKAKIRAMIDANKAKLIPAFIAVALVYITMVLENEEPSFDTATAWFMIQSSALNVNEIANKLKALLLYDDVAVHEQLLAILNALRSLNVSSAAGFLTSLFSLRILAGTIDSGMGLLFDTKYSDAHGLTVHPFREALRDIFERRKDTAVVLNDRRARPVPEFLMTDAEKAEAQAIKDAAIAAQRAAAAEAARRPAAGRAAAAPTSTASAAELVSLLGKNI